MYLPPLKGRPIAVDVRHLLVLVSRMKERARGLRSYTTALWLKDGRLDAIRVTVRRAQFLPHAAAPQTVHLPSVGAGQRQQGRQGVSGDQNRSRSLQYEGQPSRS